jgi:hypothetical protein
MTISSHLKKNALLFHYTMLSIGFKWLINGDRWVPLLERPKTKIESLSGKEAADDLKAFAKSQGIDLSLADLQKTRKILKDLPSFLSDEIIKTREAND